jgi:hypothetical protein
VAPRNVINIRAWAPGLLVLALLAALVGYTVREVLDPGNVRLPGRDSGNVYVWEVYTRSVLAQGMLPHWNPYHFAGTPHLADPQTNVLYPPAMLLRWLPLPLFLGWMLALHLWLMGAGTLFLCRLIGLGWLASAAAAAAVTLGGTVGVSLYEGHLLLIYSTAWYPWALAFAVLSLRTRRVLPHAGLVLVLGLQFLAGYLQGSLYIAGATGLYYAYSVAWPGDGLRGWGRLRPLAQLAVAGALALGLSAFQLWPTARLVSEAGRTVGVPYEVAAIDGWTVGDLSTLFFPFRGVDGDPPHRYLGNRVYAGWLLTALLPFAFGPERRRIAIFLAIIAGGAIAVALPDALPFYRWHHALFPGLRVPGRTLFLATVSIAVLGAIGLQCFIALAAARAWRRLAVGASLGLGLIAAAAVALPEGTSYPPAHMWPWLPFIAAAGACAVLALAATTAQRSAALVALAVIAADVTAFSAGAMQTVPLEPGGELQRWMGEPGSARAISVCEGRVDAGDLLLTGHPGLDGLAGIHLADYANWISLAKSGDAPRGDGFFHRIASDGLLPARRDLLDMANVSTVFSCEPLDAPWLVLVSHVAPIYTYRNPTAWPRAWWTCGVDDLSWAAAIDRVRNGRYDHDGRLVPQHVVNVRWIRGVADETRRTLEKRHGLVEGVRQQDNTWRYAYADLSASNGLALVSEPAVEDTAGIDRATGTASEWSAPIREQSAERRALLTGTGTCADRGDVRVLQQDRPDGYVSVVVDAPRPGIVFLSEPYYEERQAFVDGRQVSSLQANLAFTAVQVPLGRHRVELRYVPRSFQLGLAIALSTLVVCAGLWVRSVRITKRRPTNY